MKTPRGKVYNTTGVCIVNLHPTLKALQKIIMNELASNQCPLIYIIRQL